MYLHIGKEKMINRKDIIFILDYKGLKENKIFNEFFENIKKENIKDISENNPKTIVITKEENTIKAYISNISSNTLANR